MNLLSILISLLISIIFIILFFFGPVYLKVHTKIILSIVTTIGMFFIVNGIRQITHENDNKLVNKNLIEFLDDRKITPGMTFREISERSGRISDLAYTSTTVHFFDRVQEQNLIHLKLYQLKRK